MRPAPTATNRFLVPLVLLMAALPAACNRNQPQQQDTTAAATTEPRQDSTITTTVQAKYYADDLIRGRRIDVSTENGVVTLRGTVETDAAKQRAVDLAQSVEGVSRVSAELVVLEASAASTARPGEQPRDTTGTTGRDDVVEPAWISTKIQAQYFLDPDIKPWYIDVTTGSAGVVTLEGIVDDEQARRDALRIARDTEGVTRVDDRLRVRSDDERGTGPRADDSTAIESPDPWLTAKIQAKYFVDDDVKGRNINVDTRSGIVTLRGTVANEAERRQALALARNTAGVREVREELRVDPGLAVSTGERGAPLDYTELERPDAWISTKIQAKYFLDAEVKGHRIDVDTVAGVVTLRGTVENAQQKQEAEQIARETAGVKSVVNELVVGTVPGA